LAELKKTSIPGAAGKTLKKPCKTVGLEDRGQVF